jgi:hypothetical protein
MFPAQECREARVRNYLSEEILARFLHVDQLYRIRDARGRPLADVGEMLTEGQAPGITPELRAFGVQRHIGDYTLFILGLFPESLERIRRDWRRKDSVMVQVGGLVVPFRDPGDYYQHAGRRAYQQAAEIGGEQGLPEADVFTKLSRYFTAYSQVMGLVRMYLEATPVFEEGRRIIT